MGNLIRNERVKLYKKPSTWILLGVLVALMALTLGSIKFLFLTSEQYGNNWKSDYTYLLHTAQNEAKANPDNVEAQYRAEMMEYLLQNEIPPTDWRTDGANSLYDAMARAAALQAQIESGEAEASSIQAELTAAQAEIDTLTNLLEARDWKAYVRGQIDALNADTEGGSEKERAVELEILQMYLDLDVPPVAQSMMSGYGTVGEEQWRNLLIQNIRTGKLSLLKGETDSGALLTASKRAEVQQQIDIAMERLKTETPPVSNTSMLGMLDTSTSSLSLISLLMMVLAGGIIATEFGSGTVKLLLITPHRRRSIFWAKAVLLLEVIGIAAAAMYAAAFLLSGLMCGFSGLGSMQVISLFGHIVRIPYLLFIQLKYLVCLLPVAVYAAMALMLSAVTRKSAVAIAVSILLMYGSEMILQLISIFSADSPIPGLKFLLFSNTDIRALLPGPGAYNGMDLSAMNISTVDSSITLGFSVTVLLIYLVCFLWIARDSFCRRDVK